MMYCNFKTDGVAALQQIHNFTLQYIDYNFTLNFGKKNPLKYC